MRILKIGSYFFVKKITPLCFCMLFTIISNIGYMQYDSLARVHVKTYEEFSVNYKRGLINIKTGDTLLKPLYQQIDVFSEGLARVYSNSSVGYIDTLGHFIIPLHTYKSPGGGSERGMFSCGLAVVKKGNLFGAINKSGQVIIPFEARQILRFSQKTAITFENGKYGLINTSNKALLDREYNGLRKYKSLIYLTKNDKMAFADLDGQLKCPFEFDKVKPNRYGGVILKKNDKEGYADNHGNQIIKCQFDKILWFDPKSNTVWLKDNNVFTIMNNDLSILAKIPDGDVMFPSTFSNPIGIFGKDSIQYFSAKGLAVTEPYEYIEESARHSRTYRFKNGKCIVRKNKKWGLINQFGEVLIPFEYDWLMPPSSLNLVIAKKGNLNGLIDTNNLVILKFRERTIDQIQYARIEQLNEVITSEKWEDSVEHKISIKEAVTIAKRKNMYYNSESSDADNCKLNEEDGIIYWKVSTYKTGYTDKGDCAHTNGCSIMYIKTIKINAISGKVLDKKSTKKIYPNYE